MRSRTYSEIKEFSRSGSRRKQPISELRPIENETYRFQTALTLPTVRGSPTTMVGIHSFRSKSRTRNSFQPKMIPYKILHSLLFTHERDLKCRLLLTILKNDNSGRTLRINLVSFDDWRSKFVSQASGVDEAEQHPGMVDCGQTFQGTGNQTVVGILVATKVEEGGDGVIVDAEMVVQVINGADVVSIGHRFITRRALPAETGCGGRTGSGHFGKERIVSRF